MAKSPLEGLSGGSDYNGDSNDRKKKRQDEKRQTETENKVKRHFVYHYGNDIPLAEQIVLGNKSVFLQIDADGKPVISPYLD